MIKATIKKVDRAVKVDADIRSVSALQVYVGIPEEKTGRRKDPVNNAQLLYIHTNGSPARNIPARAVIEPAIEAKGNKEPIAEELASAARATLQERNATAANRHLQKAGMIGQNAARSWFTDPRNGWAKNSEETAKKKLHKLQGKNLQAFNKKISAGASITDTDISRPLIDTGQLRKSIIYVVKGNGK